MHDNGGHQPAWHFCHEIMLAMKDHEKSNGK